MLIVTLALDLSTANFLRPRSPGGLPLTGRPKIRQQSRHHRGFEVEAHIHRANMPAKSRFTRLDAFTKTVEDARIRTTSGGIVTIASLLIVFYLVWGEWSDYRRVTVHPQLIVDKGRGRQWNIGRRHNTNISICRRANGDTPQCLFPPDTLRTPHTRCNGRIWRATNGRQGWSKQGPACTHIRRWSPNLSLILESVSFLQSMPLSALLTAS